MKSAANTLTFQFTVDEAYMLALASHLGCASMAQDVESGAAIMALLNLESAPHPTVLFEVLDKIGEAINVLQPGSLPTPKPILESQ